MATSPLTREHEDAILRPRITANTYNWLVLLTASWLVGGGYLDAWAHMHIRLETFFTPWHAILYSGFFAVVLGQGIAITLNRLNGSRWREAINSRL